MVDGRTAVRLLEQYMLPSWKGRAKAEETSDGVRVITGQTARLFQTRPDIPLAREPWVAEVVECVSHAVTEGRYASEMFALLSDGEEYHLNDPAHVALLARRLRDGMAPEALAEILVWFHPWTPDQVGLIRDPGELKSLVSEQEAADLPEVASPRIRRTEADEVVLEFHSWRRRRNALRWLEILAWRVTVPVDGPATWIAYDVVWGVPVPSRGRVAKPVIGRSHDLPDEKPDVPEWSFADRDTAVQTVERLLAERHSRVAVPVTETVVTGDGVLTVKAGRFVRFSVHRRDDLLLAREPWVDQIMEIVEEPGTDNGPERLSNLFVVQRGGDVLHLNDPSQVARLAQWLWEGMAPEALAEVLVWFWPSPQPQVGVVTAPDDLPALFPEAKDLPEVTGPVVHAAEPERNDLTLEFFSWTRQGRGPS